MCHFRVFGLIGVGFAALELGLLLAGCGGGGGGGAPAGQAVSGALQPNMIFYSNTPDNGATTVLNQVKPDGTGKSILASLPANYQGISMNPAAKGQMTFGYSPSGSSPPLYGIYENSSISPTGAKQIVAPSYSFVESMQVSFDGHWLYLVAAIGANNPVLYKVSMTNGSTQVLDNTGFIYSANVDVVTGTTVTYDKDTVYPNGNDKSAIYSLPTSGGTPTLLANDPNDNYEFPQFSKDGSRIVCLCDKDNPNFEVYVLSAQGGSTNGSGLTQVTNLPAIAKENGVTFSADGNSTAFIGLADGVAGSGLYVSGQIGAKPIAAPSLIVNDDTVEAGLYWTSSTGRAVGGATAFLAKRRHKGLTP